MKPRPNPFLRSASVALTSSLLISGASAATYRWDGDTNTSWTTAGNWATGTGLTAGPAPTGVTAGHRLEVNNNANNPLVYTSAFGTTVYGSSSARGLVIGSGGAGSGTMTITGGIFSTINATNGNGDVIGNTSGNSGTLNISGGTFIGSASGTNLGIGGGPTSALNVNSGLATITTLNMNATTATVNLSGGTLEVNTITRTGGVGTLNLSGGTLKARQNTTSFVTGLSAVNVNSGGAVIDSNGFNITIGNVLANGGGGGGLTKNGTGTLTLTAVPAFTGATTVNAGTLAYDLAGNFSYANSIGGAGSILKSGAGVMTLSASNGFSGSASVTGGTLALTGSGAINSSSGITVNGSGAILNASGSAAVSPIVTLTNGTLTGSGTVNTVNVGAGTGGVVTNNNGVAGAALNIGTLSLAGGATITLYSNGADTTAALNVTTLTNNAAANAVTLTANNALGWTNGSTYTIIDYGTLGGSGGYNFTTVANNLSGRQIGTFSDTGSAITLGITGDSVFWTGAANANWNTSDTNWELLAGASATQFVAADDVIFNDSASGNTTIDIDAASVATNTVFFDNTTGTSYTIDSSNGHGISAGSVTKNNTGTVTLNTANTYTGGTFLNAGTLNLGNAAALGGASSGLTISGGTIDNTSGGALTTANHPLTIDGDFTFGGSNDLNLGTGAVTMGTAAGTARTITTTAGTLTLGGVISDGSTATGLSKAGNGTLVLNAANAYTGETSITAGKVILGHNAALGTTAGGTSVTGTGILDINNRNIGTEVITISGTGDGNGALVNNGADQINAVGRLVLAGNASIGGTGRWDLRNSSPTFDMGGFTLTKSGSNYVGIVAAALSNPGNIDVTGGTLSFQTSTSIGGSSANVITVRNGAILSSWQASNPFAWSLDLKNGSTLRAESAAVAANNHWAGPVTLENAGTVTIDAVGSMTISGDISGTGSAISKTGGGVTYLSGTNSYTGVTTVSAGGLVLQNTSALGSATAGTTVSAGGRIELDNLTITGESISVAGDGGNFFGALQARSGIGVWAGDVSVTANNTRIGAQSGASLEISGVISSTSNHAIVFRPADLTSTVILSGANTYTGPTSVVGGVVSVSDIGSIGTGPSNFGDSTTVADGTINMSVNGATGYLRYTGNGETTDRVVNLAAATNGAYLDQSGTGLLKFTSDFTATGAGSKNIALLGSTDGIGEIAGAIVDNSVTNTTRIAKEGTGTWVLSGNNTFTGSVTITNGVLAITNSNALGLGTKTVTINASANKMLELDGSAGDIILGSNLSFQTSGVNGVIRSTAGDNVINGAITMTLGNGDTRIISDNAGSLTINGNISANASGRFLELSGDSTADNTFNGVLDNTNSPGLNKTGTGKWILGGANTYTAATTISEGTLALGSGGSIANTSTIDVASGATLDVSAVSGFSITALQTLTGSGTIKGDTTINGTLGIGSSPGTMTFDGDLALNGVSNFEFGSALFTLGTYDLAQSGTGDVSFGGVLNLFFDSGETYATNSTVQIFDFGGTYSGNFSTINFTGLGVGQSATFDSSTGVITVVPEPRLALIGGLGLLVFAARRRR